MSDEQLHHPYGPSALASYESCPGFQPIIDKTPHPVTLSGSRIHDALESGDTSGLEDDDEMRTYELFRGWESSNLPKGSDWISTREERVEIPIPGIPGDAGTPFGTYDHLLRRLDYGILIDYKAGYVPVTRAMDNIQVQAYVYGLFHAYPALQRIRAFVLQPRIDKVTYHLYRRDDLLWVENRLRNVVTMSLKENPDDWVPSYETCRFCARKAGCPSVNNIAYRTARRYKPGLVVPKGTVHASEIENPKTMGRLMDIAKILEDWVASVKFHASQLYVEQGTEPDGYRALTRGGRRTIADPISAEDVAKSFGVPHDEFLTACTVSPSGLAKLVRERARRGDKKQVEGELFDQLRARDAYHVGEPTTYLKRETTENQTSTK